MQIRQPLSGGIPRQPGPLTPVEPNPAQPSASDRAHNIEDWAELAQHSGRIALRVLEENGSVLRHALEVGQPLSSTFRAASIGIGAASAVLGSSEIYQGIRGLRQGERLHPTLSLIGGSSTLVAAASMLTQGLAPSAYAAYPWEAIGNTGQGVGAICDGVEDVIGEPGQERRTMLGLAKMASGGLMVASGLTGSANLGAIGSTLYLGCLFGQYREPIQNWIDKKLDPTV